MFVQHWANLCGVTLYIVSVEEGNVAVRCVSCQHGQHFSRSFDMSIMHTNDGHPTQGPCRYTNTQASKRPGTRLPHTHT